MSTVQCVVRPKGEGAGDEFKKTAEIAGEGRGYYSSLSDGLSQIQSEVNAHLTQLVEKEKAEKIISNQHGHSTGNYCAFLIYIQVFFCI